MTFLILLMFAVAVRARDFGNPSIHVDEQFYLLVGDRMLHGALPYLDIWDRKPIGLFLLFAGMRLLPGDGILAYQLVATLCAALTGLIVALGARRLGARPLGVLLAGCAYILWLSFLSGRGGQSPVYYNLLMAAGGYLTLCLPERARHGKIGAILASGMVACLLAGLAIQIKYTPLVEGAFFGIAHLWYLHRAGARIALTIGAGMLWATLGIAPTLAAILYFKAQGAAAFDAFWFSNFTSIALRRGYPAGKIAARLAGSAAQLSPFVLAAAMARRFSDRDEALAICFAWLAAALIAFAMIGAFFDHYALPLLGPLAMIAGPALGRSRLAQGLAAAAALILAVFHLSTERDYRTSIYTAARVIEAHSATGCPYVFAGDSVLYVLARACVPTRYAFPSTLAYAAEQGATGTDEAAEVRRILARRPPVIVTLDAPLSPWNTASKAVIDAALQRDYSLALSQWREEEHLLVYVRHDPPARR
ncbi:MULTISPECIES: hypothetical protein [unclassified Sphingomonas]|nr:MULTISPECIES: hypothetical protein [unclassified Sphingomonas]